jgi:protein phosphatase PTC7
MEVQIAEPAGTQGDGLSLQQQQEQQQYRTPKETLHAAHMRTQQPGSSTACVMRLCPKRTNLLAANLGDSGFAVVRDGQVHFQSSPLQHFFDCPYQFGARGFTTATDTAEDAAEVQVELQPGDVVLAATDGLWDNLPESEWLQMIPRSPEQLEQAAVAIAKRAREHMEDDSFHSPYAQEALKQGFDIPWHQKLLKAKIKGMKVELGRLSGGKIDDVTVVLAMAVPDDQV